MEDGTVSQLLDFFLGLKNWFRFGSNRMTLDYV